MKAAGERTVPAAVPVRSPASRVRYVAAHLRDPGLDRMTAEVLADILDDVATALEGSE